MHRATILGLLAFVYAGFVGITSMGISTFFGARDLLAAGHAIVLLVFVGGGLGMIAWTKQFFGDPLVNVACSLASLACIVVLVQEGAVQSGQFSDDRVGQILIMVLMGIVVSSLVNVLVLPISARTELRRDMVRTTDLLGELLITITRAFLSGREDDLQDDYYTQLQTHHEDAQQQMSQHLAEAKNEFLVLGQERLSDVSEQVVGCLGELSQGIGGLRSAALAQFALVNPDYDNDDDGFSPAASTARSPHDALHPARSPVRAHSHTNALDPIAEAADEGESARLSREDDNSNPQATILPPLSPLERITANGSPSASELFLAFLHQLGPSTKSLVFTLKQTLDELPFRETSPSDTSVWSRWCGGSPRFQVHVPAVMPQHLDKAVDLYQESRQAALHTLIAHRAGAAIGRQSGSERQPDGARKTSPSASWEQHQEVLADIEDVSACCAHFSFSLLDFAQATQVLLRRLAELRDAVETPRRSWHWLNPWQRLSFETAPSPERGETLQPEQIPTYVQQVERRALDAHSRPWYYHRLYRPLRFFQRDNVRFAIKVGLGAVLYAVPAFLRSTRPTFRRWRGEWGLISYMVVCCMTIGASNTTTASRFVGTAGGACLGVVAWLVATGTAGGGRSDADPVVLAACGGLVAAGCFYLILARGQGPMGRFVLLTYNLVALYAYSLTTGDPDASDGDYDEGEGGLDPYLWDIVQHRVVAVVVGCMWGILVTRTVWPISARRKLPKGLCTLWLRMGGIWKRDPLSTVLLGPPRAPRLDIRNEAQLHTFCARLTGLQAAAQSEFELRGPFPAAAYARVLEHTRRMLDALHALRVVLAQRPRPETAAQAAVLRGTRARRFALAAKLGDLFTELAATFALAAPLHALEGDDGADDWEDAMAPGVSAERDRLLARVAEVRRETAGVAEEDLEVLYTYVLVTGQVAREIAAVRREGAKLFGVVEEEDRWRLV